jgi:hypothetical protein
MRETLFFPELGDRRMVADWQQDRKGLLERARAKVRQVLNRGDHPEYLTPEQVRELERIAQRAGDKAA